MRRTYVFPHLQALLLGVVALIGCGGTGPVPSTSTVSNVSVSCTPASVVIGSSSQCAAVVAGSGTYGSGVTWSATNGTVSASGLFTPSVAGSGTVTATSTQDATRSGSANVTVTSPSAITGVVVSCSPTSILVTALAACAATVSGTGSYNSSVTWTATNGTIAPTGLFNPASAGPSTITATSVQDASRTGSSTVTVVEPNTITGVVVRCSPATATPPTFACMAAVSGTGAYSSAVSWSATSGTITPLGLFTVTTIGDVTITATSIEDPAKSGILVIHYNPSAASPLLYGVALSTTDPRSLVSLDPSTGTSTSIFTFPQENVTALTGGALDRAGNRYFQIVSAGQQSYQLDTIDLTGHSSVQILPNVPYMTNLAYNRSSGLLYGVWIPATGSRSLVSLDPSTGVTASIFTFPQENVTVLSGGTVDADGGRYFQIVSTGAQQTYQLDVIDLTGRSALRTTANVPDMTNLTYNASTGLLYGVDLRLSSPGDPRRLASLEPATGRSNSIYTFPLQGATTVLSGGALDPAGNRYFQIVSAGSAYSLDIIDLAGTSALRIIPNVPDATNFRF